MPKTSREPVKSPLVWAVFVLIFALLNPWYLPAGSYTPLFLGVPYWAWMMLAASLALSVFVTWAVARHWDIAADAENDAENDDATERTRDAARGQD